MNPNVYSLWSQTPLSLGYITKACSLIGQFTCTLQKLCLEMAFFRNFKYVFWRLQTRCLKFENCFGITGLILLKWDIVQHDHSLGEKVDFSLVTDLWPYKHVVQHGAYVTLIPSLTGHDSNISLGAACNVWKTEIFLRRLRWSDGHRKTPAVVRLCWWRYLVLETD